MGVWLEGWIGGYGVKQ